MKSKKSEEAVKSEMTHARLTVHEKAFLDNLKRTKGVNASEFLRQMIYFIQTKKIDLPTLHPNLEKYIEEEEVKKEQMKKELEKLL